MSAATKFLDRLSKVRQVAPGRYVACCPSHKDRSPSLSIRECDDGRVLIHDFGGCDTDDVLAALGLTTSDLFPERIADHAKGERPNHWHVRREAFECIHRECLLVALAGETLAAGTSLSLEDRDRLCLAATRIRHAIEVCR